MGVLTLNRWSRFSVAHAWCSVGGVFHDCIMRYDTLNDLAVSSSCFLVALILSAWSFHMLFPFQSYKGNRFAAFCELCARSRRALWYLRHDKQSSIACSLKKLTQLASLVYISLSYTYRIVPYLYWRGRLEASVHLLLMYFNTITNRLLGPDSQIMS